MKKYRKLTLAVLLCSAVGFFSFQVDDRYFEIAKNLDIFATLFKEVNNLYVDEINPTRAMNVGIKAMLKELDPYTVYYTEDAIENYRTQNTGKYNGIGATTSYLEKTGTHTVVMVYENSPADMAGVKIGDELISVDGVPVLGKADDQLARLLKGQRGTSVKLEIKRWGKMKPVRVQIQRDVVKTADVPHFGLINDKTGYIQLKSFTASAAKEIKAAFEEMKTEGMEHLVLDLRGNPGGLLGQAVSISNFFLPKGKLVVETKGKVGTWNKKYTTRNQPLDLDIPIVVLINEKSASASEIVSGTLQDYDRGVLIGQRSFGKGLVQTTRPLSYNTQLKVTTAKYYIPSGRCIQAVDYSHRRPDGSVGKLPDSLRATFFTKNKRAVYDGGGVDPDIAIETKTRAEFTKQLIADKVIFDFATKYYFEHEDELPTEGFKLSDEVYESFISFSKKQDFKYKSQVIKNLEKIKAEVAKDKNLQTTAPLLTNLENELTGIYEGYFQANAKEIKEELELEILSRYHYDKVMKFVSFEKDSGVQEALSIFAEPARYEKILQGN